MQKNIAMLRGINVSGQKIIKMEDLRDACSKLGFKNVESYVQSGNLVFDAANATSTAFSKKISKMILDQFGFEVPVVVRTAQEMETVIIKNPFLKKKGVDLTRLYVTFLGAAPAVAAFKNLEKLERGPDSFVVLKNEIYLYCPKGYGNTKLSNNFFEKALGVEATTRNWKSVNALFAMAQK